MYAIRGRPGVHRQVTLQTTGRFLRMGLGGHTSIHTRRVFRTRRHGHSVLHRWFQTRNLQARTKRLRGSTHFDGRGKNQGQRSLLLPFHRYCLRFCIISSKVIFLFGLLGSSIHRMLTEAKIHGLISVAISILCDISKRITWLIHFFSSGYLIRY